MFGPNSIVNNSEKENWVYSGIGITFHDAGSRNLGNNFASKVVIFGIDNSSSARTDNCKNNLLMLGDEPTYGINGRFGSPEKKFNVNFSKARTKCCLSWHYNGDNSLKPIMKMFTFQLDFV